MRTLQEKYNAIQQGKFSKDHFLAEARMQQPQLVTRFNGYDDAVQILKNRGMIKEGIDFSNHSDDAITDMIVNLSRYEGNEQEIKIAKDELARRKQEVKEDYSRVLELPDGKYFAIDGDWEDTYQGNNGLFFTVQGNNIYDKDGQSIQSSPREFISQFTPEEILKVENVNEARLTEAKGHSFTIAFDFNQEEADVKYIQKLLNKARVRATVKIGNHDELIVFTAADKAELEKAKKAINSDIADEFEYVKNVNEAKQPKATKKGLADYRYKPTNEMDKYPYEQILRGLRVELEGLGVNGTPTAEQYAKALAKVSKNLAKDPIFYTNQVAGVNPNVDLHDQMVDATAKNTVDTFNGMKKAELKEGFKKLI